MRTNVYWVGNLHIIIICEESCDTEDWRLLKIQLYHYRNTLHFKICWNWKQFFLIVLFTLIIWLHKCSLGEHKRNKKKIYSYTFIFIVLIFIKFRKMFSSSFCKHWQLHYSQNLKLYFGVKQEVVTSAQLTLSPPALSSPYARTLFWSL